MNNTKASITAAIVAATFAVAAQAHEKSVKEQLGSVKFPVSCSAEAQKKFNRAMALFHSFDWNRGKTAFEEVAQADPKCGMAHWGQAMVAADNPFAWPVSIKLKDGAEAIAYEQAMEKVAASNPRDIEAKILYALAVSANHDLNDKRYERPLKAAGLLEPLFKSQPRHPGVAHYLIHSYDYPPIADKGLAAAKRYAKVAADAAHAQHMPSHIFTRVGFWRDSVAANKASAATDSSAKVQTPHAFDYMVYAYLQLGEDAAAESVWAEAKSLKLSNPAFHQPFGLAAIPSRLALERGRWAEAAKLELPANVADEDWKRYPHAESVLVFARGLGAARSGDAAGARKDIERLRAIHATLTERKVGYWAEQSEVQAAIVHAWALKAEGKNDEALAAMRASVNRADGTEK